MLGVPQSIELPHQKHGKTSPSPHNMHNSPASPLLLINVVINPHHDLTASVRPSPTCSAIAVAADAAVATAAAIARPVVIHDRAERPCVSLPDFSRSCDRRALLPTTYLTCCAITLPQKS
jgi:hypothetical protein